MSFEVHIDWQGRTHLTGRLHAAERGSSVSFEYAPEWLQRSDAFAIDPTLLPLQRGAHHGKPLFGAIQDCGPDRWGRVLIERAVRKKVLAQKPYRDIDYALALDDVARIGALRFRLAGNILRGRIVDEAGKPIPKAYLETSWGNDDNLGTEWQTRTDANGNFEWDSVPSGPMLFLFEADGYQLQFDVSLVTDGSDHEITLKRVATP